MPGVWRSAVAHLVELGHRRIAFLGDSAEPSSSESVAARATWAPWLTTAFAPAMSGSRPVRSTPPARGGARALPSWYRRHPGPPLPSPPLTPSLRLPCVSFSAWVFVSPLTSPSSGVGGSDFAPLLSPPLTTVRLPVEEAGRCAAEMLLEMIAGGQTGAGGQRGGQRVLLPCPLVVRESCGAGAKARPSTPDQADTSAATVVRIRTADAATV